MNRATMVGLGCGGFALIAALAGFWGWWSTVRGMDMTNEPAEVRSRTAAIVALVPAQPLAPFFARTMERGGGDRAVIWSVDSRFQNLMLVIRESGIEPASAEEMVEALALVHPGLSGFDPQPGGLRVPVRVLGQERPALVQTALTVDESKQTRSCVAFPYRERWILAMLQGDSGAADATALQQLLADLK
jgi:hypothetical protein